MRFRTGMVLAALLGTAMGAAPTGGDLGKMQGQWEALVGRRGEFAVSLEIKGHDVAATIIPKVGPKLRASGELRLDEAASPRALDWVKFSTLDGTEVPRLLSIYQLEGDRLILRSGGFNDARPKAFEKGGEGCWTDVLVFKRPAPPKSAEATSDR